MNEMVSVIMPVYNTEKYVEEAICSVYKPSFSPVACILVKAALTSVPASNKVCWNESLACSCCAFEILYCARNFPFWKMGCVSDAMAFHIHLLNS